MKPVRILIVEDDPVLLHSLGERYCACFAASGYLPTLERASTVEEGRRLAKAAKLTPYDFVSLDVNLGDSTLTGLDVLDTFRRFHSAWMVALVTGVETDTTVDKTMGREKGESLRKQLRRDAYARFPAERLIVVEKPSAVIPAEKSRELLADKLGQIVLVYEEVSRLRYIFRPVEVISLERVRSPKGTKAKRTFIETAGLHWQVRFNCGELRTLPDMAGFRTVHGLLSLGWDESLTPEEALVREPKNEQQLGVSASPSGDPVAAYFEAQDIAWTKLSSSEQEKLIRAALSLKFDRFRELRGYQDEDELSSGEEGELVRLVRELGPLAETAELAYQRLLPANGPEIGGEATNSTAMHEAGLHLGEGNYDRLGSGRRGQDSPAAQLFRARMKRVKDCLRENGFADFAQHLEDYVQSTGANWSYHPPTGIEWTT